MISSILKLVALLVLLPALNGCAGLGSAVNEDVPLITWPSFPLEPRIQWVRAIHTPLDAGIEKGLWRKVVEFISGTEVERIVKPYGTYVDSKGRIFIADAGSSTLHMLDMQAKEYAALGAGDKKFFISPIGITGDDADNIYITDSEAAAIYRYNSASRSMTTFLSGSLKRPTGIAFNPKNRLLYITDTASHQIVIFDLAGRERHRIGTRGEAPGSFNYPTDLFIDAAGDLHVTDALNSRIQIFSSAGQFIGMFGSEGDIPGYFAKPKGVATDSDGNIYVCDAMQDNVQIFNRGGRLLLNFGDAGNSPGQFWMPSGIFIDRNDTIYVSDTYNSRIQIFRYLKLPESKPASPALK